MVTAIPTRCARADRVVLPGVGAFADCRRGLDAVPGMVEALNETVRDKGRPFLGICVGMQLMAERGREYEVTEGLGWIAGEVDRIAPSDPALKIPHMGWNTLDARTPHPLLDGIPLGPDGLHAYFVHSYHLNAGGPRRSGRRRRLWRPGHRDRRARQLWPARSSTRRRASGSGFALIANFLDSGTAVILFPAIDLKDGAARAPGAGRHGARDRVQPRSGGAGACVRDAGLRVICTSSISTARSPASR